MSQEKQPLKKCRRERAAAQSWKSKLGLEGATTDKNFSISEVHTGFWRDAVSSHSRSPWAWQKENRHSGVLFKMGLLLTQQFRECIRTPVHTSSEFCNKGIKCAKSCRCWSGLSSQSYMQSGVHSIGTARPILAYWRHLSFTSKDEHQTEVQNSSFDFLI